MMDNSFYRYRSIENLLGKHQELESQEIYFASPEELNDPMEGFQDVFWQGDYILWKNLIKHYILCLTQAVAFVDAFGTEFEPSSVVPILSLSASTLPTPALSEQHEAICAAFFAEPEIEGCIARLAETRPRVHREELSFYLSALHGIVLHEILTVRGRGYALPEATDMTKKAIQNINHFLSTVEGSADGERMSTRSLFELGGMAGQQLTLLRFLDDNSQVDKGRRFVAFEFASFYCQNIPLTLCPQWYAACFVGRPTHAAMWAHYGDRHEGVCLKFRAQPDANGAPSLLLNGIRGQTHGPNGTTEIRGDVRFRIKKVNYAESFPQIDFFRSLGRLPMPVINRDWYSDGSELSPSARSVFADEEAWRAIYWDNQRRVTTTKLADWQYEDEYRIVVAPFSSTHTEKRQRLYKYDFADLQAVIFGMNTSMDGKLRIVKIIEQKCAHNGRKEFEFLQANYSSGTSRFHIARLDLVRPAAVDKAHA